MNGTKYRNEIQKLVRQDEKRLVYVGRAEKETNDGNKIFDRIKQPKGHRSRQGQHRTGRCQ